MANVFFKRVVTKDYEQLSRAAKLLFETALNDSRYKFEGIVPIKVHFGEEGNVTYVPQDCYMGVIESLEQMGVQSAYIETNVLYRGARTTATSHKKVALKHGFDRLPVIIADGEHGDEYIEVPIHKDFIQVCKIGKAFGDYKQYVVMSHFKGHGSAGFGGAMKQLAMGFGSRGGKLAQHSGIKPYVVAKKCISCGACLNKCDVDAIELLDKAQINPERCVGCAGCIAVCPVGAIRNDWEEKDFKEKISEYAYGAQLGKEIIYVSFLMNVTKECDCMGQPMHLVAEDIGVFASTDPVAIDAACIDLLQKEHGAPLFDSGRASILHGAAIGLGSADYELIELF